MKNVCCFQHVYIQRIAPNMHEKSDSGHDNNWLNHTKNERSNYQMKKKWLMAFMSAFMATLFVAGCNVDEEPPPPGDENMQDQMEEQVPPQDNELPPADDETERQQQEDMNGDMGNNLDDNVDQNLVDDEENQ